MRTDFQIAVLLGLAGIAAGAALMTAPEYIRTVKEYPAPFFWAGLVLAVALTAVAIVIAVRSEAAEPEFGNTRRMIALGGMVISGLAFVGSASAYFWPMSRDGSRSSDIVLFPPMYEYNLTWNADSNVEIILLPNRPPDDTAPLTTGLPIFRIKNLGKEVAKDLELLWECPSSGFLRQRAE